MMNLDAIPLGTHLVGPGDSVTFTYVVQRRLVIKGIAIKPVDSMLDPDSLTIVTHAPERANVRRFEDGFTISDMGISRISCPLEISPKQPFLHRLRMLTDEERSHVGARWFVQNGIGYMRAEVGERVVLRVHNHNQQNVEAGGLLLCLHANANEERA